MSSDKILLASYVPGPGELPFATRTLDFICQWFKDAELIVPINPPTYPGWLKALDQSGLKYTPLEVPESFVVDSDASSCLWGLKYIKEQGMTGKRLWFSHTKSVTRRHYQFTDAIGGLYWSKRFVIQALLDSCKEIGAVTPIGGLCNSGPVHTMEGRCSGKVVANGLMALHSFMVWKWDLLEEFLGSLEPQFFNTRLTEIPRFDRYFVERDLATIPSLYGKVLAGMHLINHFERHPSEEEWNKEIQEWATANNLGWMPTFKYDGPTLNIRESQLTPLISTSA